MAKPSLNYYQALHVGKDKTDVIQFTTIQAAIDAITDNASGKRYAIYVHPGTYNEKITMEDYVDLIAVGGREETIITFTATVADEPTLTAENSMVKGFTIISDGTNFIGRCVQAGIAGFEMDDCVLEITNPQGTEVALNAIASFDMRNCVVDAGGNALTGVALATDAQTYNIKDSELGAGTNSLILAANTLTLNLLDSRVSNLIDKNGGTANIRNSVLEEVDEDGGTLNLHDSYVETIAADGGTVTAYGGTIRTCSSSSGTSFVWWEDDNIIKVIANMLIAHALAAASAGDVILVYPGTYAESNLTLIASVNLVGTDPDQCQIVTGDAGNPILNSGVSCTLSNLTIGNTNAGAAAIAVTAGTLTLRNCYVYGTGAGDSIAMTGGALTAYDTQIGAGDIDISTGACTLSMYRCRITTDPIDTAGAFAHTLVFEQCDFGNQNIASAATGATTLDMTGCSHVGQVSNAGTGAFTIRDSDVGDVTTTSSGDITIYGGDVGTCAAASAAGAIVWWKHTNLIYVLPAMLIAHALAAASAGDTIQLGQGTWAESNLTAVNGVDIIGEGQDLSIIEATDDTNPIITVGSGVTCVFQQVKISNLGTAEAVAVSAGASAAALTVRDCLLKSDAAGSIVTVTTTGVGSPTLVADLTTFDTGADAITVTGAVAATVIARACVFDTCTLAFSTTGANHIFRIDACDFSADNTTFAGITLSANVPVVTLSDCSGIGIVTHNTASTVNIYNCRFSNTYTIGAVAGVVNAYNTQLSTFTNGGSGAISFEECFGTDINNNSTSTMHIKGGHWNTVLQGAAAGTINIREAVVDTELDCSAGGAINAYNCQIDDIDCNGGTITLFGGDLQAVSDVTGVVVWWETPHRLRVISSTANMKIMDAADAAAAGDLIVIGPGTFTEALDLDAANNACTFRGMGRDKTVITQTGNTVLVDGITGVVFEDITIQATAGTNGQYAIELDASTTATASVTLRNVTVDMTGTADGVTVYGLLVIDDGTKVATIIAHDCTFEADTGNTNYAVAANPCTTATSTISLYNSILNGATYDVYNNYLVCDMHECELQGGGAYIANNAGAVCLVFNNESMADPTPVVFAGAAGVFADLSGCELWSCSGATEALYEWVYISANDTVDEADADGAGTYPSIGVIVYKPSDTTCYVKKHGYLYKPNAGLTAGAIEYLHTTAGEQTETRPSNAVVQKLGVAKNATTMLVNVDVVENPTKWLNIPIAWGAGSAPTGTHVNGNSRRAVAIVGAGGQTVFSQMVAIPEDFLTFSKLYAVVFPTGTGTFDWTAYSSAASNGEAENTHSDTDTADGQAVTDNQILDHDISGAADGYTMVEQDKFSAELIVDVLTTITQLCVLGFKLEYIAQYGS